MFSSPRSPPFLRYNENISPQKIRFLTVRFWCRSVLPRADLLDTYWITTACLVRTVYWSVTSDILLNSKVQNSPDFVSVVILIAMSSFVTHSLFHDLFPGDPFPSVRSCVSSCVCDTRHRDCDIHRLKISGNFVSRSFQIIREVQVFPR